MSSSLLQRYTECYGNFNPLKVAVTDGLISLSYGELVLQSNRLARCLIHYGLPRSGHVILCMHRSVQNIVAMMGVLKADAVYIPIEARTPTQRRNQIIRDCQPHAIICDAKTIQTIFSDYLSSNLPPIIVLLGSEKPAQPTQNISVVTCDRLDMFDASPLTYKNTYDDVACILYTSGSTGNPKGVMITHRNIDEYIAWAVDRIGIKENDKILCTAPFYFDMSLFDVYGSLKVGATLCIATELVLLFPSKLVEFAEAEKVTVWKGISSLLMYLARTGAISSERLPTLKTILFSGETLHAKYLIEWMRTFPKKTFYNAYGPTEATGISMYYRVEKMPNSVDERIPIGKPCENTEVFLLDENNKPVPQGKPGELCIKGVRLSKGYLNDLEKTKQVFIDNPLNPGRGELVYKTGDYARLLPDGNYEFIGRLDGQVKFMGYRIELSDIEHSLVSIDGVSDAGAILVESSLTGLEEPVAYVEVDSDISLADIMAKLKKRLPRYMLPKRLFHIERLPRTDRGKIDRTALLTYHFKKGCLE